MTFTITRSKWFRGKGASESSLLRDDGTMCCFGFCAVQLGVPEKALLEKGYLDSLPHYAQAQLNDFFSDPPTDPDEYCGEVEKQWVKTAYSINDDKNIDDAMREQKLSALAAANGHEFVFVD